MVYKLSNEIVLLCSKFSLLTQKEQISLKNVFKLTNEPTIPESTLGAIQTSKIELSAKIVNN